MKRKVSEVVYLLSQAQQEVDREIYCTFDLIKHSMKDSNWEEVHKLAMYGAGLAFSGGTFQDAEALFKSLIRWTEYNSEKYGICKCQMGRHGKIEWVAKESMKELEDRLINEHGWEKAA